MSGPNDEYVWPGWRRGLTMVVAYASGALFFFLMAGLGWLAIFAAVSGIQDTFFAPEPTEWDEAVSHYRDWENRSQEQAERNADLHCLMMSDTFEEFFACKGRRDVDAGMCYDHMEFEVGEAYNDGYQGGWLDSSKAWETHTLEALLGDLSSEE